MDGGAWWAAAYEVAQSRTQLRRLSSSSSKDSTSCQRPNLRAKSPKGEAVSLQKSAVTLTKRRWEVTGHLKTPCCCWQAALAHKLSSFCLRLFSPLLANSSPLKLFLKKMKGKRHCAAHSCWRANMKWTVLLGRCQITRYDLACDLKRTSLCRGW